MPRISHEIEEILEKRRELAKTELDKRKQLVYDRVPLIASIDEEISLSGITLARMLLKEPDNFLSIQSFQENLIKLKEKKRCLLEQNGFSDDYLEPRYHCPFCADTGSIADSSFHQHKPCVCYRQLLLERLYKVSNLLNDGQTGFDWFNPDYYESTPDRKRFGASIAPKEQILKIKSHCLDFIASFEQSQRNNLYFFGPTGTGKTFVAKSIGLEMLQRGYTVLYLSAPSLFEIIRKVRFHEDSQGLSPEKAYNSLIDTQLLILDDLGTEPNSDARHAEFLTLLEARKTRNLIEPTKTIISSNLDIKRLYQEYDQRITSRIAAEFDALQFIGDDIRILKKFG